MQEEVFGLISPGNTVVFSCGNPQTWEHWMELFWLHTLVFLVFMSDTEAIH